MLKTDYLQLKKPELTDLADINVINDNMDIIDNKVMEVEAEAKNKNGGDAKTVGGKSAEELQNYNNLTNKPLSLPADGGNADTLDGKHAEDFAVYSHNHDDEYLKLSGGTVTGSLNIEIDGTKTTIDCDGITTNGSTNVSDIEATIVSADKFIGDGSQVTNVNYNNLTNKPDLYFVKLDGGGKLNNYLTGIYNCVRTADAGLSDLTTAYYCSVIVLEPDDGSCSYIALSESLNEIFIKNSYKGVWQKLSLDGHTHKKEDITNFPTSLPADGGNADTVGNKTVEELQNYNNLTNKPTSLPANGGNADTVGGKTVSQLQNYNNLTNKPSSLPANGGNADTLDGKHSTDFVGSSDIISSVDWNTLTETGVFHIITTEGTNRPAFHHGSLFVDNNVGTPYQIFIPDGNTADIYKRKISGEWVNIGGCNYKKSVSFTVQTGSWFRFAKCKNALASGVFMLAVNSNNGHSSISTFSVSQAYSLVNTSQSKITRLSHSSFNTCVTKVRLDTKYGSNVEQYIDFYLEGGSDDTTGNVTFQFFGQGWEICDIESNNVITDYTTQEITL